MTNERLTDLMQNIHSDLKKRKKEIIASFYPYRTLRCTISVNRSTIQLKISHFFKMSPEWVIKTLGLILFSKIYKFQIPPEIKSRYNDYIFHQWQFKKNNNIRYIARGKFYDLSKIFDVVNSRYFDNKINIAQIGWSQRKSYTRLGFYDKNRNLIVISKIFDSKKVPEKILHYLVCHEMLHIIYPETIKNGRRVIHPTVLKNHDKRFPDYQNIQKWIRKNVKYL